MRAVLLLVCCAAVVVVASGCPLKPSAPPEPSPSGRLSANPQPSDDGGANSVQPPVDDGDATVEPVDDEIYVEPDTGGEFEVDLSNIPPEDEPIATSIILHFFDNDPHSPFRAHLEGTWIPYEQALDMGPGDYPDDAVIYKQSQDDATLEVLFGPPMSEFFVAAHLSATGDGDWDVIEIVAYDPYDGN